MFDYVAWGTIQSVTNYCCVCPHMKLAIEEIPKLDSKNIGGIIGYYRDNCARCRNFKGKPKRMIHKFDIAYSLFSIYDIPLLPTTNQDDIDIYLRTSMVNQGLAKREDFWKIKITDNDISNYKSAETTKFKSIISSTDEIKSYTDINSEKDNAISEINKISEQINIMKADMERLTDEKEKLISDMKQLSSEKDTLILDVERLTTEKDKLIADMERLSAEKDILATNNEKLTAEKNNLTIDNKQLITERDNLVAETEKFKGTGRTAKSIEKYGASLIKHTLIGLSVKEASDQLKISTATAIYIRKGLDQRIPEIIKLKATGMSNEEIGKNETVGIKSEHSTSIIDEVIKEILEVQRLLNEDTPIKKICRKFGLSENTVNIIKEINNGT